MKAKDFFLMTALLLLGAAGHAQNGQAMQPFTGPGHYTVPEGTQFPIRIPFRMHNRKPVIELQINDQPATLMIDNGVLWDQVWLFGSPLVETLQLRPLEEGTIGGAGEGDPTEAYESYDLTLHFPNITFYQQPVLVSPPAAGFARMFPGVDGQLCNTFFKHFLVEFNFVDQEIILHDPQQFQYHDRGCVLDLTPNESGTHSVPFSVTMMDGTIYNDRVDVDFGGIYPLKLALNNHHQIALPDNAEPTHSYGAQGKSSEYRAQIQNMTFGDYTFSDIMAVFGDEQTSRIHPDNLGVIGLPLFQKFHIIFDYLNQKLYLEPNAHYDQPFE